MKRPDCRAVGRDVRSASMNFPPTASVTGFASISPCSVGGLVRLPRWVMVDRVFAAPAEAADRVRRDFQFLPKSGTGQAPVRQVPPAQLAGGIGLGPEALNSDNCFTGRGAPHFGQCRAVSFEDLARYSNAWPQWLHWYSNKGITSQPPSSGSGRRATWPYSRHHPCEHHNQGHRSCQA